MLYNPPCFWSRTSFGRCFGFIRNVQWFPLIIHYEIFQCVWHPQQFPFLQNFELQYKLFSYTRCLENLIGLQLSIMFVALELLVDYFPRSLRLLWSAEQLCTRSETKCVEIVFDPSRRKLGPSSISARV